MKKIFKRLIAYIIDIFLITALSSAIMQLPLFNNDLANYNKYYKQIPHGDSWTAEYGRV